MRTGDAYVEGWYGLRLIRAQHEPCGTRHWGTTDWGQGALFSDSQYPREHHCPKSEALSPDDSEWTSAPSRDSGGRATLAKQTHVLEVGISFEKLSRCACTILAFSLMDRGLRGWARIRQGPPHPRNLRFNLFGCGQRPA